MRTSTVGMSPSIGRPMRRVAAGVALVGVTLVGGVAIGLGGDDSNGRDGSTVPGAPTDAPTPVDVDDGRGDGPNGKAPKPQQRSSQSLEDPAAHVSAVDNGRGGVDPAVGPLAVTQSVAADTTSIDSGSIDTDSGVAPRPDANVAKQRADADAVGQPAPVDQDVPGASHDWPDGPGEPSNDSDG